MLFLIPLLILALYIGMYVMRTEKTGNCRWRQTGKDEAGIDWFCPVCGMQARTEKGEPKHCGAKPS